MVIVYPEGTFYSRVKVEDVDEIVIGASAEGPYGPQHLLYVEIT